MSKLTKLVQSKENKNNFCRFNILFKKRVSTIKIKIINLNRKKDLKWVDFLMTSFVFFHLIILDFDIEL